jgi:hypothetical protein
LQVSIFAPVLAARQQRLGALFAGFGPRISCQNRLLRPRRSLDAFLSTFGVVRLMCGKVCFVRDIDVRRVLHTRLRAEHPPCSRTLVIDEFDLAGAARVDVAVINGSLSGYEIKSARDTLRRLPAQIETYSRVFDLMTIVVASSHLTSALEAVPDWWSVVTAHGEDADVVLVDQRRGAVNHNVESDALVWLLWRDELLAELAARDLVIGLRSKPRRVLCERLTAEVTVAELQTIVRDRLRARENWRPAP